MPIRKWTNWDSQPADEDFWDSLDHVERKRQARRRSQRQERMLEKRRERHLKHRRIHREHYN